MEYLTMKGCRRLIRKDFLHGSHKIVGIKILDHIVMGDGRYFSFEDEGLIERYKVEAGDILRRLNL